MFKYQSSINRSGKGGQGSSPLPIEPTTVEVQQMAAAIIPFEVYPIALSSGRLISIGFDQVQLCPPGSAFALLCRASSDGVANHRDVFFISQIMGISKEFQMPTGESVRTVWLRGLRRPGQLGPNESYGDGEPYMLNVDVSASVAAAKSEIYYLPAVDSFFSDLLATTQKYTRTVPAMMDSILYHISDTAGGESTEEYQVYNSSYVSTKRLEIGASTPITSELMYSPISYVMPTESGTHTAYASAPVLGFMALAMLEDPEHPGGANINLVWGCLHKAAGGSNVDTQLLVTDYPSKAVMSAVVASKENEEIMNAAACAYHLV